MAIAVDLTVVMGAKPIGDHISIRIATSVAGGSSSAKTKIVAEKQEDQGIG
ncbi:hypothetical protein [Gluconacetobacter diazotrophicus]|uniref:Uncharacterized protein n=2 Tax=Gluconacetobacter diazotrophicus TaxID=33996 RepID=A9HJD4_GLUDA|nr:hypothetical protein [Gluconacetobacter diazotrophicus]MBB2157298.1 hypothetical protein [Gluconacetobacter diazotrophicus]CAP55892.1 hypothetical protein GDI1949 [Gluconacetobacter diazotrophicus PA1 5]